MVKLIRDKIPEIIRKKNKKINESEYRIIENDSEYFAELQKKLLEEVNEFIEASSESNKEHAEEEIADILEVLDAICAFKGYNLSAIQAAKAKKKEERGGFEKRILWISNT